LIVSGDLLAPGSDRAKDCALAAMSAAGVDSAALIDAEGIVSSS
jgi:hypothetical protein